MTKILRKRNVDSITRRCRFGKGVSTRYGGEYGEGGWYCNECDYKIYDLSKESIKKMMEHNNYRNIR